MTGSWIFKIMVVGSAGVGKTSFLNFMTNSNCTRDYSDTIGVDFSVAETLIDNDVRCFFQFWDLNSRNRYRSLLPGFFPGASGCLLFFDTSNYATFSDLSYWINLIRNNVRKIPIILIGTKTDLSCEVINEEILELVRKYGLSGYYSASIYLGFKKEAIFWHLARNLIDFSRMSPKILFLENLHQFIELNYDERKTNLLKLLYKIRTSTEIDLNSLHSPSESTALFRNKSEKIPLCSLSRIQLVPPPISFPSTERDLNREYHRGGFIAIRDNMLGECPHLSDIMEELDIDTVQSQEAPPSGTLLSLRDDNLEELTRLRNITRVENDNSQEVQYGGLRSLREEMLEELERLRNIMRGTDIEEDEKYKNLSEEEKSVIEQFLAYFSECPICKSVNHKTYLLKFYFDTDPNKERLKDSLLYLMCEVDDLEEFFYNKITLGIPCCDCFKKIFKN